ncbi:MAG: polysaccharide biosynthesis/export family protein, partial [Luteolibacter sp.]
GAPEMNAQRTMQPVGIVSLPIIGEVSAAGQTTSSLQDQLSSYYKKHLAQADVSVDLESSVASVYVSGEVLAPGKVPLLRPLTALEAVMEVGGFSKFANPRHVIVIRHENGRAQRYQLNLHDTLNGRNPRPFHLRPFDVVYVKPSVW